jgi:DNA-binding NarL/FixJ family response regulator
LQLKALKSFYAITIIILNLTYLLLDIGLPGIQGINKLNPDLDIIILTVHQDPDKIFNAIHTG